MSVHSTIDQETFKWLKAEVEATLDQTTAELQSFVTSDDKQSLYGIANHLHQIVGSLQMLELKPLSTLILEAELLTEELINPDNEIGKSSFVVLLESSFSTLRSSLQKIQQRVPESPITVVELINQIRALRGLNAVEISSLFSPMIDVFPEVKGQIALSDEEYRPRASALRARFQVFLLRWLRDSDEDAIYRLRLIADKLLNMSTFGAVARLWWVVTAYVDFVRNNELQNRAVHGRIFRGVDDLLRNLQQHGESALVRDPGEELIKIMLFYTGVGEGRTERMDEVVQAFKLQEYFPALQALSEGVDYNKIQSQLEELSASTELPLPFVRQLVTNFFQDEQSDSNPLLEIVEQLNIVNHSFELADIDVITPVVAQLSELAKGLRNGSVDNSEDTGFHLASAIMFVENSLSGVEQVDEHWVQNGQLKLQALTALCNQQPLSPELDGTQLTGSERRALLDVVGTEVEENLKHIEENFEAFSIDSSKPELLAGIDKQIRQVRGALQVLGEQKMGLLLQMSENQFTALQAGEVEASKPLIEALATSIGTMEEYVQGLQRGRTGMDDLLDRSITDLEVAIGKKVSRADVETLLENASDSLFSWLTDQSDFSLFMGLKSNLRDLLTLAKKTKLVEVEQLVKEQDRLVDVISQEPAFLTENITASLQNNMASITEQVIQLYGTQETIEERESDATAAYKKSLIKAGDGDVKIHDDMDIGDLQNELDQSSEVTRSSTEIAKQHAVDNSQQPMVDDAIFDVFVEESESVLQDAQALYTACQSDLNDRDSIRDLRRSFHTLKGSARMVGLEGVGEIAWFSESLFNYVLDTEKPLTRSILEFARQSLVEIKLHLEQRYQNQHLINIADWGARTEKVLLEDDSEDQPEDESEGQPEDDSEDQPEDERGEVDAQLPKDDTLQEHLVDSDKVESNQHIEEQVDDIKLEDDEYLAEDTDQLEQISDSEIDVDSVSFSVIDDQQMRDVFVQEAQSNLGILSEQLARDPLTIEEDDALSISVHTLLGNAKTLGLKELSDAFEKAENLCVNKQLSGSELDSLERVALSNLLTGTHTYIAGAQNQAPYFPVDPEVWVKISGDLQLVLDQQPLLASGSGGFVSEGDLGDTIEIEDSIIEMEFDEGLFSGSFYASDNDEDALDEEELLDINTDRDVNDEPAEDTKSSTEFLFDDELSFEKPNSDDPKPEEDMAAARVAAVLTDLEPIDDLLREGVDAADTEVVEFEKLDDLDSIEQSLRSIDDDDFSVDEEPSEEEPKVEEEPIADKKTSSENVTTDDRQSLIPDDLTDLIDEDLLALGAIIQATPEDQSLSDDALIDQSTTNFDDGQSTDKEISDNSGSHAEIPFVSPEHEPELTENLVSDELKLIFLDELKSLNIQLDEEVANLASLKQTPAALANIMRDLHTIKGSALVAEANNLGQLTHQIETYLEGNFIRDEDELREVRKTLEMYVDEIDSARRAYGSGNVFITGHDLLARIGADIAIDEPQVPIQTIVEKPESIEIGESLALLIDSVNDANNAWKSARGWKNSQRQYLDQISLLEKLLVETDDLQVLTPLVNDIHQYVKKLSPGKATEYKHAKALLEEAFDVAISNASAVASGRAIEDFSDLQKRLQFDSAASDKANTKTLDVLDKAEIVEAGIFVPGSKQLSELEQEDLQRQSEGAKKRAAALRIRTDTLDSLTNYVGDASMNRSQMREDVVSIKSVVDGLYDNVARFGKQLRELEIEADSKISSQANEFVAKDRGSEFDPLEMDRYTKLQQLSRGLAENLDELGEIQTSLSNFVHKTETSLQKQDRLNRELQDEILQVRLVSFGGIGPQLRQVVRRTARELDKDVELELIGTDVRLDKTILDGVVPALEHMLRNAVDHGIETASVRARKKKRKTGRIVVECRQVAREIVINIRDDGAGVDLKKIRRKAIDDGILADDQPLNPEDVLLYISQSGFSTASKLTQISGRGVGLDVVQTTLRRMSGVVSYDFDNRRAGASFTIRLPISLAVSSGMFVEAGSEQFAIAARTIERVVNVESDELIGYLKADKPTIEVDKQSYTLIDLTDYLGYESKLATIEGRMAVILVTAGVQNIAIIVEQLLDTQEIVVKSLGGHLGRIPIYSGATIRADGNVVLLIDLIGISYFESFTALPELTAGITYSIPNVMVVDDSLTVRKSAERDINALGINAILAKDGLDAQVQLRQDVPDMILLDIEMPRMDGFELLEWVKQEATLKNIPVVMISSRATEKHISKATKLGCTAFLGKPYLLENLVSVFNQHLTLESPIVLGQD